MNNNTQLPTGPIIGVHPAVRDGVERVAYLDGDLLRCNTDVEFTSSHRPAQSYTGPNIRKWRSRTKWSLRSPSSDNDPSTAVGINRSKTWS